MIQIFIYRQICFLHIRESEWAYFITSTSINDTSSQQTELKPCVSCETLPVGSQFILHTYTYVPYLCLYRYSKLSLWTGSSPPTNQPSIHLIFSNAVSNEKLFLACIFLTLKNRFYVDINLGNPFRPSFPSCRYSAWSREFNLSAVPNTLKVKVIVDNNEISLSGDPSAGDSLHTCDVRE